MNKRLRQVHHVFDLFAVNQAAASENLPKLLAKRNTAWYNNCMFVRRGEALAVRYPYSFRLFL